jgi:hypothetical protein
MITVEFDGASLKKNLFIVKVSYVDPMTNQEVIGVNSVLATRLSMKQVASVLLAYVKDTYKLTLKEVEGTKRFPGGYYESSTIDSIASDIHRLRFIKYDTIEVPKVVYVEKTIKKEL